MLSSLLKLQKYARKESNKIYAVAGNRDFTVITNILSAFYNYFLYKLPTIEGIAPSYSCTTELIMNIVAGLLWADCSVCSWCIICRIVSATNLMVTRSSFFLLSVFGVLMVVSLAFLIPYVMIITGKNHLQIQLQHHFDLPDELIRALVLMKLHAVGLRGAHSLMPTELSGGMSRCVVLARAIALDPTLIMYDEPFAGLDPISLNVIANLIRTLNDALGVTSIVVTYDVSESLKICDHVFFIDGGRIVAQGPTREMIESDDPCVRQFVHTEADGPVAYPAGPITQSIRLGGGKGA